MAGNFSSYLEEALLNHIFRGIPYTSPTTVYIGIISDVATDTDLENGNLTNEISSYTGDRRAISFTAPTQLLEKGTVKSDSEIDFENMPAINVKYAIIADSATPGTGNILVWSPANTVQTIQSGDTYRVPLSEFIVDLD